MTTLAIGDVHGCVRGLMDIIEQANRIAEIDRYVFLGDLVDRGPDSAGVIRTARSLSGVHLVRGNHDDRFMRFWRHVRDKNVSAIRSMTCYHAIDWLDTIRSLGTDDHDWLMQSTFYLRATEHNAIFVHGGISPRVASLPENEQEVLAYSRKDRRHYEEMMYLRHVTEDGDFVRCYDDTPDDPFWAEVYDGRFGHAYSGHTPHAHSYAYKHATILDGGLVFGGCLRAAILANTEEPIIIKTEIES